MKLLLILSLFSIANYAYAQDGAGLDLLDPEDLKLLEDDSLEGVKAENGEDDLEELKDDIGDVEFILPPTKEKGEIEEVKDKKLEVGDKALNKDEALAVFDVGKEEKELVEIAKTMRGKIPDSEWNEIAGVAVNGTYEVVSGDWLWKISKKLFGSGFYYSKIWALNPYITNPHEIEPGMILAFSTGDEKALPQVRVGGDFSKTDVKSEQGEFEQYGDGARPDWVVERENLKSQGVYIQYSSADTLQDLKEIGEQSLVKEYESYEPPRVEYEVEIPTDEYDDSGFTRDSKISLEYKEGFHLNTFVSTNIVQDFGKVDSAYSEQGIFSKFDTIYVRFDENVDVVSGDKFSIYISEGKVKNKNSDREGFQYTIVGSVETVQKHKGIWECKIIQSSAPISRGDRITIYTPKIESITKNFNPRLIESVLIAGYARGQLVPSFGDVVYLDRGRADGVEVGNVFNVYGFKDRGTGKNIADDPTYKNGELTIITVTENFSTAIVTNSRRDFEIGDVAITKTKEAAARALRLRQKIRGNEAIRVNDEALDELDIELNLDDLNDSLLDKADKIQFTEDELAELERQEQEKSIISENEKDLKALEKLESEIEEAEKILKESKLDEDKLLESENLDNVEGKFSIEQQESLEEIEENFGKRYLDEELNDKENPFGLTEFDIEEIDELLNIENELE